MTRKTIITRMKSTASALKVLGTKRENLRWKLAGEATALKATFPAGGEKAFLALAATETGFTEGDIGNLVRAFETREDLTPAQRKSVETWTTDAVLTLRGKDMSAGNRTKVIAKAETKGTQNVKTLRDIKKAVVGGTSRSRTNKTDQNVALAKTLAKDITRLFKNHPQARLALIAGAQFAQDNPGKDIAAVLTFAAKQPEHNAVPAAS